MSRVRANNVATSHVHPRGGGLQDAWQAAERKAALFHVPYLLNVFRYNTSSFINLLTYLLTTFLPEVREFIKDTRPKTNTTRGGRKAHRPTPKTRTIHPTVLPDR